MGVRWAREESITSLPTPVENDDNAHAAKRLKNIHSYRFRFLRGSFAFDETFMFNLDIHAVVNLYI